MDKAYERIVWHNEPSILTPLNETNLNKMDYSLDVIDDRVVTMDTTKANQSDLLQSLKTVSYNDSTGVFTFTFWNGSTYPVDLNIEKIPVSFSMSPEGVITMTTADGTQYTCDISTLIKLYTFIDSDEIDFTVTTDESGNKSITASIKSGSITGNKLQPNYLADCVSAKNGAEMAESNAQGYAINANASALESEGYAVGEQGGVPVGEGSPYYHNNAKYYAEQSDPTRLESLSDVSMSTKKDKDLLMYDITDDKWENKRATELKLSDEKTTTTGKFETINGGKLESCMVAFEPIQSGSGDPSPSNVRPITDHTQVEIWNHGKNLADVSSGIGKNWDGNTNVKRCWCTWRVPVGNYVVSIDNTTAFSEANVGNSKYPVPLTAEQFNSSGWRNTINLKNSSERVITVSNEFPYIYIAFIATADTISEQDFKDVHFQIESGTTATTYEPYNGQQVVVNLGGTYGQGTLDVVTGELTIDKGYADLGDLSWTYGNPYMETSSLASLMKKPTQPDILTGFICSFLTEKTESEIYHGDTGFGVRTNGGVRIYYPNMSTNPTTFASDISGQCLVYELATPQVIQLTPQQINTLIGENNIDIPLTGQSLDSAVYRELFAWDDVTDIVEPIAENIDFYVRNGFLSKSILPMSLKKIKSANTSGTWNGNTYTYNNVTYTIQTDINNNVIGIKCEGTTTSSNSYLYLTSVASLSIEDNTSITMSGCPSGGSWGGGNSTYAFRAVYGNYGAASNDVGNGVTFNYNSNYKRFYIEIASNYEITTGGLIFKPMISYSVNTDVTFTPYAPSNNTLDAWKADITSIGTNESDRATASKAYAIGEHFYKDGKFCTAKTAIAQGATLSLNTNYEEGNVASVLDGKFAVIETTTDASDSNNNVAYPSGFNMNNCVPISLLIKDSSNNWRSPEGALGSGIRFFVQLMSNGMNISAISTNYRGVDIKLVLMRLY